MMGAVDFVSRGRSTQQRVSTRRLRTIDALARSIAVNLPKGMAVPISPEIPDDTDVRKSATQIASGTTYGFNSGTPASDFRHKFALYNGNLAYYDVNTIIFQTHHLGNGSDPSTNYTESAGSVARFVTWADKFEILAANYLGFRVRVNGKYTRTGRYGNYNVNADAAGAARFWLFDFTGTEFAGEGLKHVEIIGNVGFRFRGVRVPIAYTIEPWPAEIPLKCTVHGDSKVDTVSDTGTSNILHGNLIKTMQQLGGLPQIMGMGIGGAGFVADTGGTRSDFLEQSALDFVGRNFDVVWQIGGYNDGGLYGSAASYQAKVERWIATVLADNPDTIIVMTGPIPSGNGTLYSAGGGTVVVQNAKKAACAKFPKNCAFIETIGNAVHTGDGWIFGSGRQGATTGNGNADLLTGTDAVHHTGKGHLYLAHRILDESARVLPLLASRIRDGVITGVNDRDLH